MKFVAAKCPCCGADIQVDENTNRCFCQYCGSQILVEEAIQTIKGTVQIDYKNQIDNFLLRANDFLAQKRYNDAEIYFNKVLDLDARNVEAKNGLEKIEGIIDSPNLFIERGRIRPTGEAKTILFINGEKIKIDLDDPISTVLPIGTHTIAFKRAACKSKPITITVKNKYDKFRIRFTPKTLSIQVELL